MKVTASILPKAIDVVFNKIEKRLKNSKSEHGVKEITESEFLELFGLFNNVLQRALNLLDVSIVTLYKNDRTPRSILEISSSSSVKTYKLLPHINYCSCEAFKYQVLISRKQYTCKHILAVRIAEILDKIKVESTTIEHLNFLLQHFGKQTLMTAR